MIWESIGDDTVDQAAGDAALALLEAAFEPVSAPEPGDEVVAGPAPLLDVPVTTTADATGSRAGAPIGTRTGTGAPEPDAPRRHRREVTAPRAVVPAR
jgi:hypothetical protein